MYYYALRHRTVLELTKPKEISFPLTLTVTRSLTGSVYHRKVSLHITYDKTRLATHAGTSDRSLRESTSMSAWTNAPRKSDHSRTNSHVITFLMEVQEIESKTTTTLLISI